MQKHIINNNKKAIAAHLNAEIQINSTSMSKGISYLGGTSHTFF